jgi:hypothetical protein
MTVRGGNAASIGVNGFSMLHNAFAVSSRKLVVCLHLLDEP